MNIKLKIKKSDEVIVIAGRDKGKKGKVLKVFPKERRVIVAGINVVVKHSKPTKSSHGGITYKEMPIHISNVAYLDPKLQCPTKIGLKFLQGNKVRIAKKSGEVI